MADANTTRYAIVKPEVGASADTWGAKLNTNLDDLDALLGAITTTGSANAYVLTTGLSLAAYVAGQSFDIKANFTNSGAATINVDTLGAKSITKNGTTALASGDITSGNIYRVSYDGTQFQIIGFIGQPLDATLTALAALSWSSGNALVQFTAADTISLTLAPSVTSVSVGDGAAATPSVKVGDEQNGLASASANTLNLVAGGSIQVTVGNGFVTFIATAYFENGSAATPSINFANDTDNGWYRIGADNWAGSVGGSKFVDYSTTLVAYSLPVTAPSALSSETGGALTSASRNRIVALATAPTIDGNVFTANDCVLLYNDTALSMTITQGSTGSPTQRLAGSATTGNLTLAARGYAFIRFKSATEWAIQGNVT